MRNKSCSISNSQISRAFSARSFGRKCLFAKFFGCSGCALAARGRGLSLYLEHGRVTQFSIRAFFPGYRGLSCVLQNAPCRMPDVFQIQSPRIVASQALHVLKRSVEIVACGAKNLSHSNINYLRSAK